MQMIETNACDICCRPQAIKVLLAVNTSTGCGYTEELWLAYDYRLMSFCRRGPDAVNQRA